MFGANWDEFWWTSITGPSVFVSAVASGLLENANVVLRIPSDLPWRHSMRSAIQSEFRNRSLYPAVDCTLMGRNFNDKVSQSNIHKNAVFIWDWFSLKSEGYKNKVLLALQDGEIRKFSLSGCLDKNLISNY